MQSDKNIMKKTLLVGRHGVGKTTLKQVLRGEKPVYVKTQSMEYGDWLIYSSMCLCIEYLYSDLSAPNKKLLTYKSLYLLDCIVDQCDKVLPSVFSSIFIFNMQQSKSIKNTEE